MFALVCHKIWFISIIHSHCQGKWVFFLHMSGKCTKIYLFLVSRIYKYDCLLFELAPPLFGFFFFRDAQFSKMYLLYSWLSLCCISISLYCNGICVLFWTTIWRNKSDLKLTMLSLDFRRSWKIYYFGIFLNNSYSPKRFLSTLHIKYQTKQIQSFTNYCMSLKCI